MVHLRERDRRAARGANSCEMPLRRLHPLLRAHTDYHPEP